MHSTGYYSTMPLLSPPTSPTNPAPLIMGSFDPAVAATSPSASLRKRKADILVPTDSPLTKRFRKLNLREPSKIVKRVGSPARSSSLSNTAAVHSIREPWNLTPPPFQRPSSPPPAMEMDDTPFKIYVNDLDSSDDDAADSAKKNPIIFLCDVEREMSKIPTAVLKASATPSSVTAIPTKLPTARSGSGSSTDLILYRPLEKVVDEGLSARKMVIDAKERFRSSARGSTMEGIKSTSVSDFNGGDSMGQLGGGLTDSPMSFVPSMPTNDPDAMVLDDL